MNLNLTRFIMTSRKRNIWSNEETSYFLKVIKENKRILGFMNGKRIRGVTETFKTLVAPMKEAGFARDAPNLQIKWKNLKAEYYKIKREHNPTNNGKIYNQFWDDLDDILRKGPSSKKNSNNSQNSQENVSIKVEDISADEAEPETYNVNMVCKDEPDWDEATSPSNFPTNDTPLLTSAEITQPVTNIFEPSKVPDIQLNTKKGRICEEVFGHIRREFAKQIEEQRTLNRELLEYFFQKQENLMTQTMERFLEGLKKIFRENSQP